MLDWIYFQSAEVASEGRIFYTEKYWDNSYVGEFDIDSLVEIAYKSKVDDYVGGTLNSVGGTSSDMFLRAHRIGSVEDLWTLDINSGSGTFLEPDTTIDTTPRTTNLYIGGMGSRLFSSSGVDDKLVELDPSDGSEIGTTVSAQSYDPRDIGGTNTQLFYSEAGGTKTLHEMDPDDLSTSLNSTTTWVDIAAVGGTSTRLYLRSEESSTIYYREIDPADITTSLNNTTGYYHTSDNWAGSIGGTKF